VAHAPGPRGPSSLTHLAVALVDDRVAPAAELSQPKPTEPRISYAPPTPTPPLRIQSCDSHPSP
jgi:hypothetical protein